MVLVTPSPDGGEVNPDGTKKKKLATTPPLEEEAAYQKWVKWLQDHGKPLKDAATEPSEEEYVDSESSDQS